jgi:hypothetical protein
VVGCVNVPLKVPPPGFVSMPTVTATDAPVVIAEPAPLISPTLTGPSPPGIVSSGAASCGWLRNSR